MYRRWLALLLAACMVIGMIPAVSASEGAESSSVSADEPSLAAAGSEITYSEEETQPETEPAADPEPTEAPDPGPHLSDDGLAFLKEQEGFCRYAYWDYSQWSIGYGTCCGHNRDGSDVPEGWLEGTGDGITEAEAEALLRSVLPDYEAPVQKFAERNGLNFSQNEFDALVSFTYNCGSGWTDGCRMTRWILNPTTELEFVDAMGAWCYAGSSVLSGLVSRRIREAQIFLYGDYTGSNSPQYTAVWYRGNGGTFTASDSSAAVVYYPLGVAYGSFPEVVYEGHTLTGWFNSVLSGEEFTERSTADQYRILYAHWEESGMSFTDVRTGDWFYEWVKRAYELNLFNGLTDTTFGPNDSMTRAMVVTVLYRLEGQPEVSGSTPFTDLLSGYYYNDAVVWAYQTGVVKGTSATTFSPDEAVTREQLAVMLYRYVGAAPEESDALSGFPDASAVSEYARPALNWAVTNEIIGGSYEGGTVYLLPKGNATRAQVAAILVRYIDKFQPAEPAE